MYTQLLAHRKKRKLRQRDVAELIGLKFDAYRHRENGLMEFRISECLKLSELFGVSVEELFRS